MKFLRLKSIKIALALAGFGFHSTAAFAQDPASIYASAGQVKEIAEKAKAFLELIGYMPSKPDPMAEVPARLQEVQEAVDRIEEITSETLDRVRQLQDLAVREENERALDTYLDVLELVTEARISMQYLASEPTNSQLARDADTASRLAVQSFESRNRMYRVTGPDLQDVRYSHVLTYGSYLNALAIRVGVIQSAKGQAALTQEPYRSELKNSANFLRNLRQSVLNALEIRLAVQGPTRSSCTSASLSLYDRLGFDRLSFEANIETVLVEFPEENCNEAFMESFTADAKRSLLGRRLSVYGGDLLEMSAAIMDNYSDYGQSTVPQHRIPIEETETYLATFYNERTAKAVAPVESIFGAKLQLVDGAAAVQWLIPNTVGVWKLAGAELCVGFSAEANDLILQTCTNEDRQIWERQEGGRMVHKSSGKCLSGVIERATPTPRGPRWGSFGEAVHLTTCRASTAQKWGFSDPNVQPPPIR
jgi:hypothetical protein